MDGERSRQQTGRLGEDAVCRYLEARGHRILARNRRLGHLELDIISQDLDGIHFVEVKTRRPPVRLDPQECVTLPKQKKLARAALAYLSKQKDPNVRDCECHFDVAAVVVDGEKIEIHYFAEAFIPIYY